MFNYTPAITDFSSFFFCAAQELEKTREALSAKKAALDKSWAETKELKRSLNELRAAKDVS